jgi:hypothetical protein
VQFVLEQGGRIRVVSDGVVLPADFLDLSGQVLNAWGAGLVSMAFPGDAVASGRVFVSFVDTSGNIVVARFRRSSDPLVIDPASRFDLIFDAACGCAVAYAHGGNYGGHLAFNRSNGFLHIAVGDGGGVDDPDGRAQSPTDLHGKLLRIDVGVSDSDPAGYRSPPGNVVPGLPSMRPEIWMVGLRNPWRFSFDEPQLGGTGQLFVGDVGRDYQQIFQLPGATGAVNLGWPSPVLPLPVVQPRIALDFTTGTWITAGFVDRGRLLGTPWLGRFFFADFMAGRVFSYDPLYGWQSLSDHTAGAGGPIRISSFGLDAGSELYAVSYDDGMVYLLDAAPLAPGPIYVSSSQTGAVGSRAEFRVSMSGTPVPGIQWQVSTDRGYTYSDISGATGATYTIPAVQPTDGVHRLRAVVSNSAGTRYSDGVDVVVVVTPGNFERENSGAELTVWRATTGTFYWTTSSTNYTDGSSRQWGNAALGDRPFTGDIDGDGLADLVVWRASTGTWYWATSSSRYTDGGSRQWGNQALGDVPFVADIDGDFKADLIVWRPSTGMWYWTTSSSGYTDGGSKQWGSQALGDVPLLGDLDNDGKADLVVWRAPTGMWYWTTSRTGYTDGGMRQFGNQALGDVPLLADVDGNLRDDPIIWRASTGTWYWLWGFYAGADGQILQSPNQAPGDQPALRDINGDRKVDFVVWRPSTGTWYWVKYDVYYGAIGAGSKQFGNQALGDARVR